MATISGPQSGRAVANDEGDDVARITGNAGITDAPHEQIVFCHDAPTGLRAIIALYATGLGPGLGGTRFYPYDSDEAAIADVLNLSKAMAYKNAMAGLDFGGGKAVIIGNPATLKSEALLRAYGRFVQSLNGRYVTACDVGTYSQDMDIVARECKYVTGRTEANGGAGDSSVLTAFGVFQGMRAAAEHLWGQPSLAGRTVAIEGVGKVGSHLVDHLISDHAAVIIYDVNPSACDRIVARYPEVRAVASREDLIGAQMDIYSPCALGGSLDERTVTTLRASIICGGANNQLKHPDIEKLLTEHDILYAPDYVVNAGGVIQVADEVGGFSFERAKLRTEQIFHTTKRILEMAAHESVTPAAAADRLAERRMSEIGRLKGVWLPS